MSQVATPNHDPPEYQRKTAQGPGKWWYERYPDWLAPYAFLAVHRNQRTIQMASGGKRLLDLGCGFGDLLYLLRDKYDELYGIDPSTSMIQRAHENFALHEVANPCSITQGLAEELDFPDGYFDTVLMLDVIEHVLPEQRVKALQEVRRVLRPGGELILATPSRYILRVWNLFDNLLMIPRRLWKGETIRIWAFQTKSFTEEFCTKHELSEMVRAGGLTIAQFERVSFYPAAELPGFPEPWLRRCYRIPVIRHIPHLLVRAIAKLSILNQKMLLRCEKQEPTESSAAAIATSPPPSIPT